MHMEFYKSISYFSLHVNGIKCIDPQIMSNPNISSIINSSIPNIPTNTTNKYQEKVPTHVLSESPPLKFGNSVPKQTGYFLHPDMSTSGSPKLSINPQCEVVDINGVKSQLCPNELYNNLIKNNDSNEVDNISPQLTNKLSDLFKGSPDVSENLKRVIMSDDKLKLWNQISDIDSKQQHQLPPPKGLFNRARDKLNILTTVKESLSQELLTTEKLVKRVKSYLDENRETLQRNLPIMREILQKLPSVHDTVMQNDLAQRYVRLHKEEMEVLELYNTEKDWLVEVLSLFGSLFALT